MKFLTPIADGTDEQLIENARLRVVSHYSVMPKFLVNVEFVVTAEKFYRILIDKDFTQVLKKTSINEAAIPVIAVADQVDVPDLPDCGMTKKYFDNLSEINYYTDNLGVFGMALSTSWRRQMTKLANPWTSKSDLPPDSIDQVICRLDSGRVSVVDRSADWTELANNEHITHWTPVPKCNAEKEMT